MESQMWDCWITWQLKLIFHFSRNLHAVFIMAALIYICTNNVSFSPHPRQHLSFWSQPFWQGQKPGGPRGKGQRPRQARPRPRLGAAAGMCYPASKVRGGNGEELPRVRGQGRQLRGATLCPRPGAAAGRSGCASAWGPRGAIPHSRFGGVVVRRYPLSKVRETQVRQ